jgi:pyruvate ferredoxin oxidoreductase alpha subunit
MKRIAEASAVMAEAVKLCEPQVIPLYPITPQVHIVEELADYVSNGELNAKIIRTESEHSMASVLIGSLLAGSRSFTASSSQGLALAHEVLHIVSGMRLPAVMGVAARALSAPINIWGDHSDVMTSRDCGWIQLHCKNSQEVFDTTIQAFSIAQRAMLPVMVIMDGYTLSHVYEPIDLLTKEQVRKYLPPLKMPYTLDPAKPMSFGPIGFPDVYMEFKHQQKQAMDNACKIISEENKKFGKMFKRSYGNGLIEVHNPKAKDVIIASGTTAETARLTGACVIHVKSFRPFPFKDIEKACKGKKNVVVIDRAYSYGSGAPMYLEVKSVVPQARSAVMGLGGRDIKLEDLQNVLKSKEKEIWVDHYGK